MMDAPPKFKLYGYTESAESDQLVELRQVSLCFRDAEVLSAFAAFVATCAKQMVDHADWDHEHFFAGGPGLSNIVVTLLDERNS